jgi:hypothetical protein
LRPAIVFAALLASSACFRLTRTEKREAVDTGLPVPFGEEAGPPIDWDFGDGTPHETAPSVRHAFARSGHYLVTGKVGERLRWKVELDVIPRPVVRATPTDAQWLLFAPTVKGDLDATLDFVERLTSTGTIQQFADSWLLPALAVDASAGTAAPIVDPFEGMGVFTLPGMSGSVALLGVLDEAAALNDLSARGNVVAGSDAGGGRMLETHEGQRAWVFCDRGYAYAVFPKDSDDPLKVMEHVRAADARGFEARVKPLIGAPQGRVVLLGAPGPTSELPVDALWATVTLTPQGAKLEGNLLSKDPVWQSQGTQSLATFRHAFEGPVAALSARLPIAVLRAMFKPGSPEREQSRQRLLAHGIDIDRMFRALTGDVAAIAWFDSQAFLRNLIEAERPDPRGAAILEAGLNESAPWDAALGQMLEVFLPVKPKEIRGKDGTHYQARLASQDAVFTVAPKALKLEVGSGLSGRATADLSAQLSKRFDGAFGPGHASLLVDIARLRDELETPVVIPGLDPMQVVTVQGYAAAFLDRFTPMDYLLLDLAPEPAGAKLSGRLVLRQKGQ